MTVEALEGTEGVDCHAHIVPRGFLEDLHRKTIAFPNVAVIAHEDTYRVSFNDGAPTRPIAPGLTDPARRKAWMAENGIATQVVGAWLDIVGYDLPAAEGTDWADALTTAIQQSARSEDGLVALGSVPLQAPERAAELLRRQRSAGLSGVVIATRAAGRELDDPAFTPFWEAADEAGSVIFLHPGFGAASDRYSDFGLVNGLARLEDTTVSLARLLYRGIPAKYPRAKLLIAHGGAALPYVLGRLVRNHLINPSATSDPLESFAQLYFDSVLFDPEALRYLVSKVGPRRVLLGSDYPFPIGDLAPRAVLADSALPDDQRQLIQGVTARRILAGDGS